MNYSITHAFYYLNLITNLDFLETRLCRECLVELKEATSSLVFASSRCGEFPELHKIREILTSKFGKEFADHAVELHKNNRVNSKVLIGYYKHLVRTHFKRIFPLF